MHSLPRSLPSTSSSSSIPHPLLIGCLIGVFGTLFVQLLLFILYKVHHKRQGLKSRGKRIFSFGSSKPRHIEQYTMSTSTTSFNGTASLLRVANRNPDGSWSFTDANGQSTEQTDTTLDISPQHALSSPPWSPNSPNSPTTSNTHTNTITITPVSPTHARPLPTPPWSPNPNTPTSSSSSNSNSHSHFHSKAPPPPPPSSFPSALANEMDVVDCGSSARTGPPPYNTMPIPVLVPPIPREYLNFKVKGQTTSHLHRR